ALPPLARADVDVIAFGWDANVNWGRMPLFLAKSFVQNRLTRERSVRIAPAAGRPSLGSAALTGLQSLLHLHPWNLQERILPARGAAGFVRDRIPPIRFFQHHLCH